MTDYSKDFKQGLNGAASLLYTLDVNGDPQNVVSDAFGNMSVVAPEHYWIHAGQSYEVGYLWSEGTAIADNDTADLLVQVNAASHVIFDVAVGGDCEIGYYINPTWTASSPEIPVTPYNKNEYSSNVTPNVIYADPNISDPGTLKIAKFIPGGGFFGQGGTDGGFSRERIWKTGSPMEERLIRVTNRSGAATQVSITLEWYEPS